MKLYGKYYIRFKSKDKEVLPVELNYFLKIRVTEIRGKREGAKYLPVIMLCQITIFVCYAKKERKKTTFSYTIFYVCVFIHD